MNAFTAEAYNLGYDQHIRSDSYTDCAKRADSLYPHSATLWEYYIEGWENARADLYESQRDTGEA